MCIETTNNMLILFAGISSLSTAVIAYFAIVNSKLTKEIKELQIDLTTSIIYASRKHGVKYSRNDYNVIRKQITNS